MCSSHRLLLLSLILVLAACGGDGGSGGGGGGDSGDVTAPTAMVTVSPRVVLGGGTVTATVIFSENVIGFTAGDVVVAGGIAGAFTPVDARTYTLAITAGGAGTTTVDVDIATGAGQDAAGNPSVAASGQAAVAFSPWASGTGSDAYGVWADLTVTGNDETVVQRFRLIAPGTFIMGSPVDEPGRDNVKTGQESQHQVTLTIPYWIADSECTQRMWKAVMNTAPSYFQTPLIPAENLDLPVERVSHNDVQTFLTALNLVKANLSACLPTESQWEYAARAGTMTPFSIAPVTTDSINCYVWASDPYITTGTYRNTTVTVKTLPPNPWGLFEVHGNVWEWCADWRLYDWGTTAVTDPTGPASGSYRALRSGSWFEDGLYTRSAQRDQADPSYASFLLGFRLAAPGQPGGSG